jgi:hypothetical protein
MTNSLFSRFRSDSKTLCAILLALWVLVPSCAPARPQLEVERQVPVDLSDLSLVIHYPTPTFVGLPNRQYIISPEALSGAHPLLIPFAMAYTLFIGLPHALYEGFKELPPAEQTLNEAIRTGLANPARLTKERVLEFLASEKGLSQIRQLKEAEEPLRDDELYSALRAKYGNVTLLDIDPQSWGLRKHGSTYKFFHGSRARLIDLKVSRITWQHKCDYMNEESNSLEELAKDAAAGLKQNVEKAAEACAEQFICQLSGKQCS